jgi:hypothetical protein
VDAGGDTEMRKTVDEFEIQSLYKFGWEMVTTEITRSEARERLKEYRIDMPDTIHRIVKKRSRE